MRRPYFFELFTIVNLIAISIIAYGTFELIREPLRVLFSLIATVATEAALGVIVRVVIAVVRRDHGYFRVIRSAAWLIDTVRLIVGGALVIFTYGWIKLVVPIVHPELFDRALWDLDQLLFFGAAPSVLTLDLFSNPTVLRAVDWSYANVFAISIVIASTYFLSEPSRRVRIGFANGYALLWIAGAWLYTIIPSLGPAYRFPDIWMAHRDTLRTTQVFQARLMRNYTNVLRFWSGRPYHAVSIVYGIGAFPSLHVAFQTYVFLWMRRLWRSGQVLFGIFVVFIFLGSMITGWHYFIDGVAGLLLAFACYKLFARRMRLDRWLELRRR